RGTQHGRGGHGRREPYENKRSGKGLPHHETVTPAPASPDRSRTFPYLRDNDYFCLPRPVPGCSMDGSDRERVPQGNPPDVSAPGTHFDRPLPPAGCGPYAPPRSQDDGKKQTNDRVA